MWKVSAAVLGAVSIADMHSSVGRREANPLLQSGDGRFGKRGVTLKTLLLGGGLAVQWLALRKHPDAAGYIAGLNLAAAGLTGAVAVRNHMVK